MTWTAYKIVFRLLSPMHIGWIKQGNLQRTRPYVTGRVLWGALTARLTRDFPKLGGDYKQVGERVRQELAFSYFYPTDDANKVDYWPWGKTADEFAWRYLGSYASTALNYGRNTAEEGSLHETEFIAPTTRDGKPVCLVGYIFERQNCTLPWQQVLSRLQLGGERTYGWGRVALQKLDNSNVQQLFGLDLELEGARPVVVIPAKEQLLAHARVANRENARFQVQGSLEPLLGRETEDAQRYGEKLSTPQICWMPGSKVQQKLYGSILEDGTWSLHPTLP